MKREVLRANSLDLTRPLGAPATTEAKELARLTRKGMLDVYFVKEVGMIRRSSYEAVEMADTIAREALGATGSGVDKYFSRLESQADDTNADSSGGKKDK
jgi:hypothetical protein